MKTFKYKVELIDYIGNENIVHHQTVDLDSLGKEGWKLISVLVAGPYVKGYFVKEYNETPDPNRRS